MRKPSNVSSRRDPHSKMRPMIGRNKMFLRILIVVAGLGAADVGSGVHTLYAARVRSGLALDAPIAGNLYAVNLANGTATLVGAIRLPGSKPIGVTGMAVHPTTGILYGITSEQSPNHPRSLVIIDQTSGAATLVGDLGMVGSDIPFDPAGTLYLWRPGQSQLVT